MKYCTQCGQALPDDTAFCTVCGAKLEPGYAAGSTPMPMPNFQQPAARPTGRITFLNTGLGFILPAVILFVAFAIGINTRNFLSLINLEQLFMACVIFAALAFAVVLPARAKGPDLSIGRVMALSGVIITLIIESGGTWFSGLLAAIVAAAVVGAVNGVINAVIRVRSVLLTVLISAVVTWAVSFGVLLIAVALAGDNSVVIADLPDFDPATVARGRGADRLRTRLLPQPVHEARHTDI